MTPGQVSIEEGRLERAIREFSALIKAEPTEADGYRGRAEASLLLGRFADAYRDYYAGITAFVLPAHPDAAGRCAGVDPGADRCQLRAVGVLRLRAGNPAAG